MALDLAVMSVINWKTVEECFQNSEKSYLHYRTEYPHKLSNNKGKINTFSNMQGLKFYLFCTFLFSKLWRVCSKLVRSTKQRNQHRTEAMGISKMMMKEEPRLTATHLAWQAGNPKRDNDSKCSGKKISVQINRYDLLWKTVLRAW